MEEQGRPGEPPAPEQPSSPPSADGTQAPAEPTWVSPPLPQAPAHPDAQWQRPDGQPQQPQIQPPPFGGPQQPPPAVPPWQAPPAWQPPPGYQPPGYPAPGYPAPGQWQVPPGQVPPAGWQAAPVMWEPPGPEQVAPPFTSPPPKLKPWAIALVIVVGLLGIGGLYAYAIAREVDRVQDQVAELNQDEPFGLPKTWPSGPTPFSTGESPDPVETTPSGPQASTYPVRTDEDLERVCDGWYYPQSPKFTGKAPHQISVGVIDSTTLPSRHFGSVSVPELKESIWRAWIPTDPTKTQLVGCIDLATTGATAKSCKFDDPKPEKIALKKATYRVRLFEAATGKKLLDKAAVKGEDETCPTIVYLLGGESLVSQVSDRQVYEFFRPYVMKK
ncbi:hypothetical protein [Paractinoplanes durhamensis]|uniref:Uncharacterized protein n=1 Tax=Paractinoplanes durhamensis TaxID=113563 RepID=A0ABQ3YXD3_9ACTN|nr:hypothetical protein [Actinoplanes durhamensis]GIE02200.1 hypothetical protein Adu01nite_35500 [Actinoplanes durhamensis]